MTSLQPCLHRRCMPVGQSGVVLQTHDMPWPRVQWRGRGQYSSRETPGLDRIKACFRLAGKLVLLYAGQWHTF